jgi:hypothetical protein
VSPAAIFSISVTGAALLSLSAFLDAAGGRTTVEAVVTRYLVAFVLCRVAMALFDRIFSAYVAESAARAAQLAEADAEEAFETEMQRSRRSTDVMGQP